MKLRLATALFGVGLLLIPVFTPQAFAALGEKAESIAKDRKALSAMAKNTSSFDKYTVEEMASDGTTVREFLTPSGVVFAIAWKGIVTPDLTVLLGSYTNDYKEAKKKQARKHGEKRSKVKTDRVIVETWGHMRNLQGRAYDPSLVPKGVNPDELL